MHFLYFISTIFFYHHRHHHHDQTTHTHMENFVFLYSQTISFTQKFPLVFALHVKFRSYGKLFALYPNFVPFEVFPECECVLFVVVMKCLYDMVDDDVDFDLYLNRIFLHRQMN